MALDRRVKKLDREYCVKPGELTADDLLFWHRAVKKVATPEESEAVQALLARKASGDRAAHEGLDLMFRALEERAGLSLQDVVQVSLATRLNKLEEVAEQREAERFLQENESAREQGMTLSDARIYVRASRRSIPVGEDLVDIEPAIRFLAEQYGIDAESLVADARATLAEKGLLRDGPGCTILDAEV